MSQRRSPLPLILAAVLGIALITVARIFFGGTSSEPSAGETAAVVDPGDCVAVTVIASSEKAGLLTEMADQYNGTDPEVNGDCVRFSVSSKASGGAASAIARGWDEQLDGPRPDVWTPASSSWAVLAEQMAAEEDQPNTMPKDRPSLVQTPLVIAMPEPMARALGWPNRQLGWKDLAELAKSPKGWALKDHPEWGRFKLGKTNPNFSTSGLNATVASYFAATGLSSDLSNRNVQDPATQEFVKQLESSVVHYGDTTLTFLDNMRREAEAGKGLTYVSAVTVEEKSVWDYNQGNPTGDPETVGDQPPPKIKLAAIYPDDGTLMSDNPWLVLDAEWVDDAKRQASADFLGWLQEPEQQQRFTEAGFRTFDGQPGDVLNESNGLLPAGATNVLAPPAPAVLAAVKDSWDVLRKRAHVLMIIDVSGSMAEPVPEAGSDKLELAKQAANGALNGFAPNDDVGLWVFSTEFVAGDDPYSELVPIGPASKTVPQMKKDINRLVADGGTALYATLRAAQAQMVRDLDPGKINAIVLLSDGRNEYPPDVDLDGLLDQLNAESVDTSVRVFTIGYGDAADTESLTAIAEASRGQHYEATDPASIEKVLTSVLSNF